MNERIKELAEQAQIWIADYHGQRWEIDPKKFAELIVRECASLFDGSKEMKTVGFLSHEQVVKQIKEHFGVEE
jgi:hypothetical protein